MNNLNIDRPPQVLKLSRKQPVLIISKGIDSAIKYAKDRGWSRQQWRYIANYFKLKGLSGVVVLAGEWRRRKDINLIFTELQKSRFTIVDDSDIVLQAKRELTLLSIAHTCLNSILTQCDVGPAISTPTKIARTKIAHAVKAWTYGSELANDVVNARWISKKINAWEEELVNLKLGWSILILLSVANRVCVDVYEYVDGKDAQKSSMITDILPALEDASAFLDEKGDKYEVYEYVDELIDKLYILIGE